MGGVESFDGPASFFSAMALQRELRANAATGASRASVNNWSQREPVAETWEPETPLHLSGKILDPSRPVSRATIEIWHADVTGRYAPGLEHGVHPGNPLRMSHRQVIKTGERGEYSFSTIKPGHYPGSRGCVSAPHVHYRLTLPRGEDKQVELVTRLYFHGSGPLHDDEWTGSQAATSCIIPLDAQVDGSLKGAFNVILPDLDLVDRAGTEELDGLRSFAAMILRDGRKLRFVLPPNRFQTGAQLRISDVSGKVCGTFDGSSRNIEWDATGLNPGFYLVDLCTWDRRCREVFHISI